MEKEISNGAMLGIVLIALAAIIGLGFGVFAIAKGTANDGVNNMQENLDVVGNSAFTDYDQKIVTGTQVISAIQNFEGKPYALAIGTNAVKKASSLSGVGSLSGVKESYGDKGSDVPVLGIGKIAEGGIGAGTVAADSVKFINYNAMLGALKGTASGGVLSAGDGIAFKDNHYVSKNGLLSKNGKIIMNNVTGNLSKSGMAEYVPSGARFQAFLIKDESGTILGVTFDQLNSK